MTLSTLNAINETAVVGGFALQHTEVLEDLLRSSHNRWNEHYYLTVFVSDRSAAGAQTQAVTPAEADPVAFDAVTPAC